MERPLAFVLGGGGARGAFQVGALRALFEAGIYPDMLVGTSIGALNATYLALHGVDLEGVASLEAPWHDAAIANLFPTRSLWLISRILSNRFGLHTGRHVRDFFVEHGLTPELRFTAIENIELYLVAGDINSGTVCLYGTDPEHSILEGVLASTALPPWVHPLEIDGKFLMDGGVVSNLPIEPAMRQGAREIIAFQLSDMREIPQEAHGFGPFSTRILDSVGNRHLELELALAEARGVPVHVLPLRGEKPVNFLDFHNALSWIDQGYAIARSQLAEWRLGD